jgi:hypothetical protein
VHCCPAAHCRASVSHLTILFAAATINSVVNGDVAIIITSMVALL